MTWDAIRSSLITTSFLGGPFGWSIGIGDATSRPPIACTSSKRQRMKVLWLEGHPFGKHPVGQPGMAKYYQVSADTLLLVVRGKLC